MSARAPASIFLVEDEPMIRMLVVEMLEAIGYRVMAEAGDMTAALDLARTIECDLAILDVNIDGHVTPSPNCSGRVRSRSSSLPDTIRLACRKFTAVFLRCRNHSRSRL